MKKRLLIGVLIVGIIGSGWFYWYNIPVDMSFIKDSQWNDIENMEVPDSFEISSDAIRVTDTDKADALDQQPTKSGGNSQTNENMSQESQQTKIQETITDEELEAQIIAHYTAHFLNLREKYEGMIALLIEKAKAEYLGLPESERNRAMYTIGLKYVKKANALEDFSDKEFDMILDKMKSDLEKHNVPTDSIMRIKEQYENEKNSRRSSLMDRAMAAMK